MADKLSSNTNRTFKKFDPISLDQQARYQQDGITYISNDTNIIPRDEAGNIQLSEGATNNPLLIIDSVTERITTKSALRVLDTRFEYYKFPVQVKATTTGSATFDLTGSEFDLIYARYKPSENRVINAGGEPSGILMDEVVDGVPQTVTNSYYITKEIKNSGANLRIRVKLSHRFSSDDLGGYGTAYFTIMRNGPNKTLDRYYRPVQITGTGNEGNETYANGRAVPGEEYVFGAIAPGETQNLFINEIILNSEFEIGDTFSVGAYAGQAEQHSIISEQTYMVITDASKNVDEWNQEI
jgi:hypothetical protein